MESIEELLQQLKLQYVQGATEKLDKITRIIDQLEQDKKDAKILRELMSHFHKLSGSGGTCGFPQISIICQQSERECLNILNSNNFPTNGDIGRWRDVIALLHAEFAKESNLPLNN